MFVKSGQSQINDDAFGYYNDALLLSQTTPGGSARVQAIGGAQVGLGGDISTIMSNPAGLGIYSKSEISISPSLNFINTSSNYLGSSTDDYKFNFNLNNIGFVYSFAKDDIISGTWRGGSIGVSLTRVNNFHNRLSYAAQNDSSSIIDYIFTLADGTPSDELTGLANLAYQTYLINPISGMTVYDSYVEGYPFQEEIIKEEGAQNQWSISYGGNFNDKIYFGIGVGIMDVRYRNERIFRETFEDDVLQNLTLEERLSINGVGLNGTFGVIYRPINYARIGFTVTTPTYYWLNDEYSTYILANYNDFEHVDFFEDTTVVVNLGEEPRAYQEGSTFEYNLATPFKVNGGVAFFIGDKGFISADIEWIDYADNKLSSSDLSLGGDNRTIRNIYKSAFNYRIGGELRMNIFRLRGGFAYQNDPYQPNVDEIDLDRSKMSFSAGLGVRIRTYYIDLAWIYSRYKSYYIPYEYGDPIPSVETQNRRTNVLLTFGWKF